MKFGQARRPDPVIDVTPMIDIVFQLVLFFMVSTTFVNAPAIEVDLPKASAEMMQARDDDLTIWVTRDGGVFVDDEPVDVDALRRRLRRTAEQSTRTMVIIKADTDVNHGRVVTVMDLARSYGLSNLALATDPESGD